MRVGLTRRGWVVVAAALATLTVAGGIAWATGTGDGVIHACYGNVSGMLRVLGPAGQCQRHETAIDWNQGGPTGPPGPAGEKGPTGDKGPVGDKGAVGDKGPIGDKGATGNQGPVGDTGQVGDRGPTGATGDQGPVGEKGPTGDPGPPGPAGSAGAVLVAAGEFTRDGFPLFTVGNLSVTQHANGEYELHFPRYVQGRPYLITGTVRSEAGDPWTITFSHSVSYSASPGIAMHISGGGYPPFEAFQVQILDASA